MGEASGGTQEAGGNEPQLSGSGVGCGAGVAFEAAAQDGLDAADVDQAGVSTRTRIAATSIAIRPIVTRMP